MPDHTIPLVQFRNVRGESLEGWIEGGRDSSSSFEIEIDALARIPLHPADFEPLEDSEARTAFRKPLPQRIFDGQEHTLAPLCSGQPAGEKLLFQSKYGGRLDGWAHDSVHGWAVDHSRPGTSIFVEILVNGKRAGRTRAGIFRQDLQQAGYAQGKHGFSFLLPDEFRGSGSRLVEIAVSGQPVLITDDPALVVNPASYRNLADGWKSGLRHIFGLSEWSGERSLDKILDAMNADDAKALLRRLVGGASLPDLLYLERTLALPTPALGSETFISAPVTPENLCGRWPARWAASQPVDVIVAIYKGLAETVQCLRSVLSSTNVTPYELICILDNPGDAEMADAIHALASGRNVRIVVNPANLGFVASANRGMRIHPDRDVVLLNSDTVVYGDWLDRLRGAAYSSPEIGTVTPLSNNATICSYPHFLKDNPLPEGCTGPELDRICEEANRSAVVDIPTGVGFCMFIRRHCIDLVGAFDEASFGRGYGEENDFCLRAARRGWRNVLAAGVFVQHAGAVSFEREKPTLEAAHAKVLEAFHPSYPHRIAAFFEADPIRAVRRRIDAARLSRRAIPAFCFVTHDRGGGTDAYVKKLSASLEKEGIPSLLLECARAGRVQLRLLPSDAFANSLPNLIYDLPAEFEELAHDLTRFSIEHFHFQTNVNVAEEVFTLPARLGVLYDCTVHDYSWICPRINLIDYSRRYCGEPPVEVCERCIQLLHANPDWGFDANDAAPVRALRNDSALFLRNARTVFCPSQDVKTRLQKYFPDVNLTVNPHDDRLANFPSLAVRPAPGKPVSVALFGEISMHKGSEILRKCVFDAWQRSLPLRFVVIGFTNDDENLGKLPNVSITGGYKHADLPDLLREHKVTLSFFPAVWPETYSYTLSIALRHGLFPIAFDLGSIAERIRRTGFGFVLPLATADSPQLVNEALLNHANWMDTHPAPNLADTVYQSALGDYYRVPMVHNSET